MKQKRKIGVIQAGGTILCVDGEHGLAPGVSVEEVYKQFIPQERQERLDDIFEQGDTKKPFGEHGIDSSEMNQTKIEGLAKAISECYKDHDAIVVAHGTDTMAETATALSFLFQYTAKPIIITGSQHQPDKEGSDAGKNLADAFEAAAKGQPGVYLSFNGSVMQGSRANKADSESYEAFVSVNKPKQTLDEFTRSTFEVMQGIPKKLDSSALKYNAKVAVIESQEVEQTNLFINSHFHANGEGLILKGLGSGNTPAQVHETLKYWLEKGKTIVMASKCEHGQVDPSIYETGQPAVENGILCGLDMGTEAMKAKLKYILSNFRTDGPKEQERIKHLWYQPMANELDRDAARDYLAREAEILYKAEQKEEKLFLREVAARMAKNVFDEKIPGMVKYEFTIRNKRKKSELRA